MGLDKIPLNFKNVSGHFNCSKNRLTSLKGSPTKVGGSFWCYNNLLTTLEGSPEETRNFNCSSNQLTSLKGGPKKVGSIYYCDNNLLTTLEGSPESVESISCSINQLLTLEGGPEEVGGSFNCYDNPVYEIFRLFKDYKQFKTLLDDYNYLRGNKIIRVRFQEACIEAGIKMPKIIKGYTII